MSAFLLNRDRFFAGIDQVEHKDYDVKLPIFYYDNTCMSGIYTASTEAVKKHLPSADMHPVELFPGRCLVVFSAFEYRKTDIGPYNEFSVSVLISHGKKAIPGLTTLQCALNHCYTAYVLYLPVTSERARKGGVEMAGYPKFIADITFNHADGYSVCTVADQDQRILRFQGKHLPTSRGALNKYVIHTNKDGIGLSANLYINPQRFNQSLGYNKAQLEIEETHPIGATLTSLQLSTQPVLYQYMPTYEAILFGSKNLIDD